MASQYRLRLSCATAVQLKQPLGRLRKWSTEVMEHRESDQPRVHLLSGILVGGAANAATHLLRGLKVGPEITSAAGFHRLLSSFVCPEFGNMPRAPHSNKPAHRGTGINTTMPEPLKLST